jgi:hypothetical protein
MRIYDVEHDVESLTTVAATCLMSMTWITLGKDKAGRRFQEDNANKVQRMHLYGESNGFSHSPLNLSDDDLEAAACVTAWGSFNFHMYSAA